MLDELSYRLAESLVFGLHDQTLHTIALTSRGTSGGAAIKTIMINKLYNYIST